jgi:probable rRNA maturation factor
VKLTVAPETGRAYAPFLRANLRRAWRVLEQQASGGRRLSLREMHLVLVGDRRMSDLHLQFMNIAGPTDVLTFPIDEDERGDVVTGEVYVCVPEALRRAREHRIQPKLEVLLYALHGLLHLLGYDDTTDRAFRIMHRTEDAILSKLGVGPVFAAPPSAKTPGRRRRGLSRRSTARKGADA